MRKLFINFVLLAVGLLVGTNAWAYTGTGTEIDPYIVDNAADLKTLVKDYGGYIKLSDNIDDIGNASLSIAKAVTLNLNGKRLINQTLTSNSLISITASGKVVIKNGTLIKANGIKASTGKLYDGSNPCLKINSASAEVSLEGLTIGSNDQTTGDNRHLHYGINLVVAKSLKISEDVYFNGAKSSGSDIMIGNAAKTEVIIGEIYNESNAVILINATSAAKYESGYRPICIKKISKNNGEIYAKFQSKIDEIDENACDEGGKIFICENSFVPAGKWEDWVSKGYIDTQKYTFTTDGLVVADAGYYKVASDYFVEVIKGGNSQKYFAIDAAYNSIAAGETATIKMLKSVEIVGTHMDVTDGRNITLDLNGKTIRAVGGQSGDYFINIDGGSLSITGNGTINNHPSVDGNSYESVIYLFGSKNDVEDYSVLNVGEGVKFINTGDNADLKCLIAIMGSQENREYAYGVKVNFAGTAEKFGDLSDPEPGCMGFMTINGTATAHESENYPHITIGGTANIYAEKVGIYAAGYGNWTIEDGATIVAGLSAIEIRAGELNINGGSLTSTYDGFVCDPNSNGTTTAGAALAIAQHTTKQPITVNISQGHFLGNYAVSQCNPQQNPDEYLSLLNIEVTGGYFWSTNGAEIISVTEDRRLFLKGGVYDLNPVAFVVEGYFSLPNNPELYTGSLDEGYLYKVAYKEITETETKGTETTDWAQTTTWNTDLVPDYATNVTIGKDIVVTTPAEANKVTIEEGNTLTVKDGGTLIIGNGGIEGATAQTFIVENGGQVLIAPNAEAANLRGSVKLLADRAGLKPGKTYTGQGSDMYWQHIAIPTQGAPESITPSVTGKTFFNTWDIMKGWQNVGTAALNQSFKGYNLGNFHPYSSDGSASVVYTFVGQLVGNQPDYMVFAREGHSFFGNSYLAPLDVATMFGTLYNPELEYTLNIYDSQTEMYQPVNEATYAILGIDEIKPLQGFFIYAQDATQAQLDYNSAVYTAYLNKHAVSGQPSTLAPARNVAKTNTYDKMAQITIAATTGEKDAIYLFEDANFSDAEDNGFDARNLEHSGLDMSIVGSYANLSVLATDNLEGALLNISTNNAVEYTMTFSHMQGDMTFTDNVTGAVIAMQEGATYTFAAQPNAQLNGRFAVNAIRTMPTNTNQIKVAPAAKGIYTMMGQYVGETANWHALPAGVYVVDGVRVSK